MSDMAEDFRALDAHNKAQRAALGVPCPECVRKLPKASPTILMPQQRCRIHGYRDPRPEGDAPVAHLPADDTEGGAV